MEIPAGPWDRLDVGVLRALLATLSELAAAVVVTDRNVPLHILDADDAFCELVGYSVEELRSLSPDKLLPADERHLLAELGPEDADRGLIDTVVVTARGERVPIQLLYSPAGDRRVFLARRIATRVDRITQLERYAALVARAPNGVLLWDTAGVTDPVHMRLLDANAAAGIALERDMAAETGRTFGEIFPMADPDMAERVLALSGTDRIDDLGEIHYGDRHTPRGIFRRRVLGLPSNAVAQIFENATRERAEELRRRELLERLADTADVERRNLAIGIHDEPLQQLAAATLLVESLRRLPNAAIAPDRLAAIEYTLRGAMDSLRHLVFDLSPPELTESGLGPAVRNAVDHLFADTPTKATVADDVHRDVSPVVLTAAFRIAVEALSNARKHANAANVHVALSDGGRALEVTVRDDGHGFHERPKPGHIGLGAMRDRAEAIGGTLQITTSAAGTTVHASLPVDTGLALGDRLIAEPSPVLDTEHASLRRERDSLQVAAADARKRAARAEGSLRDALNVMKRLARPSRDPGAVAAEAAALIADAVGDACAIRVLSADGSMLLRIASWHRDADQRAHLDRYVFVDRPADTSHVGVVLRTAEPMVADSRTATWLASDGPPPPPAPIPTHAVIIAPLRRSGAVVGTMTVVRDATSGWFDTDDVDLVQCFADRVADALHAAGMPLHSHRHEPTVGP